MHSDFKILNHIIRFDSADKTLQLKYIDTPLGVMFSLSDNDFLYLLDFVTSPKIIDKIQSLQLALKCEITFGDSYINTILQKEIYLYFQGKLHNFSIPVYFSGSVFQEKVWKALLEIPYGKTCSYKDIAGRINLPNSFRAVGNANNANKIAIVVPCHRVIYASGKLGGYVTGIGNKDFLLKLEKAHLK